jgi:hypothetical protein
VTPSVRILFEIRRDDGDPYLLLHDIGTHDEVY